MQVIKALYDYHPDPSNAHELGFHKGDFFHVLSRENDEDWYEACNPGVEGARGLVPVSYFETIGKTERQSTESGVSTNSTMQPPQGPRRSSATLVGNNNDDGPSMTRAIASAPVPARASGGGRGKMVYGTVLYDFKAERDDELSANQGESIIIIAQSTAEWFVAKPIGRLGGPGLIPITFIEIRDMTSGQVVEDPAKAIQAAGVPGVADWKRMAAEYKAGSISLGKFEVPNAGSGQGGPNGNGLQQGMERLSLKNGQHYGNGSVVSVLVRSFKTYHMLIMSRTGTVAIRTTPNPGTTASCAPPSTLLFPATASRMTNTDSSSNASWTTARTGSCRGTTKTSTTCRSPCCGRIRSSRTPSSQRTEYYRTCRAL